MAQHHYITKPRTINFQARFQSLRNEPLPDTGELNGIKFVNICKRCNCSQKPIINSLSTDGQAWSG